MKKSVIVRTLSPVCLSVWRDQYEKAILYSMKSSRNSCSTKISSIFFNLAVNKSIHRACTLKETELKKMATLTSKYYFNLSNLNPIFDSQLIFMWPFLAWPENIFILSKLHSSLTLFVKSFFVRWLL